MAKQPRNNKWVSFQITSEWDGESVEIVLKKGLQISNRMLNRLTRSKGIKLNGRMPWLQKRVKKGDQLKVAIRPAEKSNLPPQPVPFEVLYEDTDLMVVEKPAGILVHPVHANQQRTLAHGIIYRWKQRGLDGIVRPVHRLDLHTSGLILIAKNSYMHQLLDHQLRQNKIKRTYLAILNKPFPNQKGIIDLPIGKSPNHPTKRIVTPDGLPARTHYQVLSQNKQGTLVSVQLETGRTHQIRVHFAHLGYPLIGDQLYGGELSFIQRQALHAYRLSFTHPLTGKACSFTSSLPQELEQILLQLELTDCKLQHL
jgi:23S rRNA pseudouridine1911/1915/1917 synthase